VTGVLAPIAIRQSAPPAPPSIEDPIEMALEDGDLNEAIDHDKDIVTIELPDGSISINLSPLKSPTAVSNDHDVNLAEHLDESALGAIGSNLYRLISEDDRARQERLQNLRRGLDLLAIKLEQPKSDATQEGISVVRHPVLLEAVLRFQANESGELLPADGPVKVRNDGGETQQTDSQAQALEKDLNHYLTVGAPEYYPDTDKMLFALGFGGSAYRKVYHHPIKRRPVAESVAEQDIILSDGAVSLEACGRITQIIQMRPSVFKRMQLADVYRDVPLSAPAMKTDNQVDEKIDQIVGVMPSHSSDENDNDRTIWECYCEIDLPGFEHKEDGKQTGLPLPYRVTLDKDSQQVLEIRRWWREDDDTFTRKEVFVEYIFVPGFGAYGIGLLHILGNAATALTGAWRLALDNGMMANFPGFLYADQAGQQQQMTIRVPPGAGAPVKTGGLPIKDAIMPLPYRDITPGFAGIIDKVEQIAQRVGGTAEIQVGEGKQNAPVGTTIALLEQATMTLSAVHKRICRSMARELQLLKELFRENPEALWRHNNKPALGVPGQDEDAHRAKVVAALENADIVPQADPNTASQSARIQKAVAIAARSDAHPERYDGMAVERHILSTIDVEDANALLVKAPPQPPPADPSKLVDAQAKMLAAKAKEADVQVKAAQVAIDAKNHAADRESKERLELINLAQTEAVHPTAVGNVDRLLQNPPNFGVPTGGTGPI
jgi:hypothetical protein